MTGSSLVPIIVPLVAIPALAVWLGMCFYAGRHPFWRGQPGSQPMLASPGRPAPQLPQPTTQRARAAGPPPVTLAGPPAGGS